MTVDGAWSKVDASPNVAPFNWVPPPSLRRDAGFPVKISLQPNSSAQAVMAKAKKKPEVKKVIWRMSSAAPLGEYLHPADAASPSTETPPAPASTTPDPKSSWRLSSLELQDGLQISEQPIDTLPDELWDEFFKR